MKVRKKPQFKASLLQGPLGPSYVLLNQILDEAYRRVERLDWSDAKLAEKAGLCYQTVHNLSHRITIYPRFLTVEKVVRAVGGRLDIAFPREKGAKRA